MRRGEPQARQRAALSLASVRQSRQKPAGAGLFMLERPDHEAVITDPVARPVVERPRFGDLSRISRLSRRSMAAMKKLCIAQKWPKPHLRRGSDARRHK